MKNLLFFIILLSALNTTAQDHQFNLEKSLPLLSNPAFTGTSEQGRINYGFSLLNVFQNKAEHINYIGYDQYFSKLHGGLGIDLKIDRRAFINTSKLMLKYAFQQRLSEKITLSLGAGIGINNQKVIYTTSNTDSVNIANYLNISTGFLIYTKKFYAEAKFSPINYLNFNGSTERLNIFTSSIGYSLTPFENKKLSFITSISHFYQNGFQTLRLQSVFNTEIFSIGTSILFNDSYQLIAGVKYWKLHLKYAYSINTSALTNASNNNSEFILQFDLPNSIVRKSAAFKMNLF